MILRGLIVAAMALVLASCAMNMNPLTTDRYEGPEFYYPSDDGTDISCRPAPPNCRPESEWPDGGIDGDV